MATAYEIEEAVGAFVENLPGPDSFIFDLLAAYGKPKSALGRLRSGTLNRADPSSHDVCWKGQVYFKWIGETDAHAAIEELRTSELARRQKVRFAVVTDGVGLLAFDSSTGDTLDISVVDLAKHFTFFLPWAGMEKSRPKTENLADVKAAERMAKLYDEIIKEHLAQESSTGVGIDERFTASLNIFFSRLLFCFFAEDTGIFGAGQFVQAIASHTQADGSDLNRYLDDVFTALDVEDKKAFPAHLKDFPYVNGGLFGERVPAPHFNEKARTLILQCGELDWSQINPDIFGSMMQAVVHQGQRAGLGMHYTSVENIMKVISPLFIEPLEQQFEKTIESRSQLTKLRQRLAAIKVFDPACGSGNFLVIAYKELRRLEHNVMERIRDLEGEGLLDRVAFEHSMITLENFYGIEIDDFAHRIASLSLHLANHQMNIEFKKQFGAEVPLIPLKEAANVVCENAARLSWQSVCPNLESDEVYVIGNPPYQGARLQDAAQKQDMAAVFEDGGSNNLDYVSLWFKKGSEYIAGTAASLAFVSTNSVTQGEHVGTLWPPIFDNGVEIGFAHTSFKWSNFARGNAGVTCVVVGLRRASGAPCELYTDGIRRTVSHINAYLAPSSNNVTLGKRTVPLSDLPPMLFGSMPNDNGNLILTSYEASQLIEETPQAARFVRTFLGAREFLQGVDRKCLWITAEDLDEAMSIRGIAERVERVKTYRLGSKRGATNRMATLPYRFGEVRYKPTESIIVPSVSSARREYIPIGYLTPETVISNLANAIYEAAPYVFGIISSRIHMVWVRAVAGRLKTDIRYSATLVYNNFPVPALTNEQKMIIERNVFEVLDVREHFPEFTLSDLYDPNMMPHDLRRAHADLDEVVEHCYRSRPFGNDEERLDHLFTMYERLASRTGDPAHA